MFKIAVILLLFITSFANCWVYGLRDYHDQDDVPSTITTTINHGPLGKQKNGTYDWKFCVDTNINDFRSDGLNFVLNIVKKASPRNFVQTGTTPAFTAVSSTGYANSARPVRNDYSSIVYGHAHPNALKSPGSCYNYSAYDAGSGKWAFSEFDIVLTDFSLNPTTKDKYFWADKSTAGVFNYVNGNPNDGQRYEFDRETVLLHELGHAVGMDHSSACNLSVANGNVPFRFIMEVGYPWTVSKSLETVDDKIEFNPNVKRLEDEDCAYLNGSANSTLESVITISVKVWLAYIRKQSMIIPILNFGMKKKVGGLVVPVYIALMFGLITHMEVVVSQPSA